MKSSQNIDRAFISKALREACKKLDPRIQIKNLVMFCVYLAAILCSLITFADYSFFNLQISLWLWFTVLFANFAEAIAEGHGKAQTDTLNIPHLQQISALTSLMFETAKLMHGLHFSVKQKGILLGAMLAGTMMHAKNIKLTDEKRLWIVNSISNLAWAAVKQSKLRKLGL